MQTFMQTRILLFCGTLWNIYESSGSGGAGQHVQHAELFRRAYVFRGWHVQTVLISLRRDKYARKRRNIYRRRVVLLATFIKRPRAHKNYIYTRKRVGLSSLCQEKCAQTWLKSKARRHAHSCVNKDNCRVCVQAGLSKRVVIIPSSHKK